ncbi:condensation domain-containing protein [Streptomyces sp. M10(2022)]
MGAAAPRPATERPERPERIPMAYAQRRLWFLHHLESSRSTYNMPMALRISGALDVATLGAALSDVVARHEILRTEFAQDDDGPYQTVRPHTRGRCRSHPSRWEPRSSTADCVRRRCAPSRSPVNTLPGRPVPPRPHRARADGGGPPHRGRRLVHRPAAVRPGPRLRRPPAGHRPVWAAPAPQYADHTLAQAALLGSEEDPDSVASRQLAHWREALTGLPEEILSRWTGRAARGIRPRRQGDLRCTRGLLPAARRARGRRRHHPVRRPPDSGRRAAVPARRRHRHPHGCPVAGRTDETYHGAVGAFVNTVVLRTDLSGAPPSATCSPPAGRPTCGPSPTRTSPSNGWWRC